MKIKILVGSTINYNFQRATSYSLHLLSTPFSIVLVLSLDLVLDYYRVNYKGSSKDSKTKVVYKANVDIKAVVLIPTYIVRIQIVVCSIKSRLVNSLIY